MRTVSAFGPHSRALHLDSGEPEHTPLLYLCVIIKPPYRSAPLFLRLIPDPTPSLMRIELLHPFPFRRISNNSHSCTARFHTSSSLLTHVIPLNLQQPHQFSIHTLHNPSNPYMNPLSCIFETRSYLLVYQRCKGPCNQSFCTHHP